MAVAVNDLVDKAELILQDTTNIRWAAVELIGWLNDGQKVIVREKPDANAINESMILVAGTKQTIPATGIVLIDVVRNMGVDGTTPGKMIRAVSRALLDAMNPEWHLTINAAGIVDQFTFDKRDPKVFYVDPPSTAANYVELIYSQVPTTVAAGADISLDDIYEDVILDYILYKAYTKDADFNPNTQKAVGHLTAFYTALDKQEKAETMAQPWIKGDN